MDIDYTRLPEHMRDGFRRYIDRGIPGGSFMDAVLSNDLMGAFGRADEVNRARMFDTLVFLRNEAPAGCHGSRDRVRDWIKAGGLAGIAEARAREMNAELPEDQREVLKLKGMI